MVVLQIHARVTRPWHLVDSVVAAFATASLRLSHVGGPPYCACMTGTQLIVEGEPAHLLVEALQTVMDNSHEDGTGMIRYEGPLTGDSGAALVHALGRVTAELHAADMRSHLPGGSRIARTDEQRRADALVLLMERLAVAMELTVRPAPNRT